LELSPTVWEAFAIGRIALDPATDAVVKEYYGLFKEIAKKPLIPYYKAVATDFFSWLDKVTK